MAVYKRSYKVYSGALSPGWSRFAVLTRYSLSTLFTSRLFTSYFVLCFLPLLIGIGYIYVANSQAVQLLLGVQVRGALGIGNNWFATIIQAETALGFILVAWCAPGMITQDFANQALQLYFSRPLSRPEYILGKFGVLALLLSCITWIPGLILFGLQAQMAGINWGWENLYLVRAIFVSSWLWIAVISLVALAVSVFVRWRIAATGLLLAVLFVLPGFGQMVNLILRTHWGSLLSLPVTIKVATLHLFRIEPKVFGRSIEAGIPVWSAWLSILAACFISVMLLNRRLKAREVVRT